MANEEIEEMLCCSCGQRVPKAIVDAVLAQRRNTIAAPDSARRAAEEISSTFGLRFQEDSLQRTAAIINRSLAAAPAESLELLRTAAVLCISGDGQPRVSLLFKELKDAQAVHGWLVRLVHGKSTTTKEDR